MNGEKNNFFSARNITYLAILLALVIVLQVFSGYFKVGATSLSFVLVPVTLGGMFLGVWAGAFLGFVFGLVVVFDALGGLDPFTMFLISENPFGTIFLCIVKGTAAGAVSALLYKLISKKNRYVATFVAAIATPIINTGIFIIGAFCMTGLMGNAISTLTGMDLTGVSAAYIIFVLCVGINFFVEFVINLICAPALYTVDRVVGKRIRMARG